MAISRLINAITVKYDQLTDHANGIPKHANKYQNMKRAAPLESKTQPNTGCVGAFSQSSLTHDCPALFYSL